MTRNRQQRAIGFTLVEITIVLIVIGLVLGGVLVGRDLIESAKLRKQISQYEAVILAANTFKNKYGCIAGDCNKASSFGLGDDGDGDGFISQTIIAEEPGQFMQHLVAAQLLNGDGLDDNRNLASQYPPARLWMAEHAEAPPRHVANYLSLSCYENSCAPSGLATMGEMGVSVSPYVNWGIDSKIDDGDPFNGRVLAIQSFVDFIPLSTMTQGDFTYPLYGSLGAGSNVCVDDSVDPAVYNLPLQARTCHPIVRFP
jgi:hypothetical protein